ncbi:FHA domain-containing protein [Enhygromyxa salina]|uniref:Oxygen regulatory protein NreC n=1 Tax=Enhygromyxa salina TaxID=215803 RepID=A0A2S9Y7U9_9BACT|nr:FHA domain-containing protein [Enhygromyxa salina]PRQ01179.1 Oxygen regulatory protein NreC [Enhygromyxa salina]
MQGAGEREADDDEGLVPCIDVLEGRSKGKAFPLERVRGYVVGRLPGAEIHIDDPGVSRRHIKLTRRDDGSVHAADMRSTNGLIVNGEKIDGGPLLEGDVISLGPDAVLRLAYRPPERMYEAALARAGFGSSLGPAPVEVATTEDQRSPAAGTPRQVDGAGDSTAVIFYRPKLSDLPISARQLEVSQLVATGMTNAAIAEQLGISPRTVTSHLDHIYGRLSISSRAALTRWIVERGLTGN